jgi:hypothetical protein
MDHRYPPTAIPLPVGFLTANGVENKASLLGALQAGPVACRELDEQCLVERHHIHARVLDAIDQRCQPPQRIRFFIAIRNAVIDALDAAEGRGRGPSRQMSGRIPARDIRLRAVRRKSCTTHGATPSGLSKPVGDRDALPPARRGAVKLRSC